MTTQRPELLDIIRIGRETSMGGEGLSMREALQRVRYIDRRASFDAADLRPLLALRRDLLEAWLAYSEDKRTCGGWYILRCGEIGRVDRPKARRTFDSLEEAVAEYVVLELDFWSRVRGEWRIAGLECPHCGVRGISYLGKMGVSPISTRSCTACSKRFSVAYAGLLAVIPLMAAIIGASWAESIVSKALLILYGFAAYLILHIYWVPLERRA